MVGIVAISCRNNNPDITARLEEECSTALAAWDGEKVDSCATILLSMAEKNGSELLRTKALFFLGSYRADLDSATNRETISVAAGTYIVTVGSKTVKLIVK